MNQKTAPDVLIINAGSSSIRFATYAAAESPAQAPTLALQGKIDRIGLNDTRLNAREVSGETTYSCAIDGGCHAAVSEQLLKWLTAQTFFSSIRAVGHRLVHGMQRCEPQLVSAALLTELHEDALLHPEHLPLEIALIEAVGADYPGLPQVACFDSAFHRGMPRVASQLALPRCYEKQGLRRYGFHGLSCEFLLQELLRLGDPAATGGRVIFAHLGNGSSVTAISAGKSVDNSMGFTPAGGMMMGSRSGDLDPGLAPFLARSGQLNSEQFFAMANRESGLLGVSERSSDLRELLAAEAQDSRAAEAIALFCYQATKWLGAYAAVLGGLDTLVFAGGIGENSPRIREQICLKLGFLGITLQQSRNLEGAPVISIDNSPVTVRVVATNEELVMAGAVIRVLGLVR